jgi:hypothetical protein
MEIKKCPKCGFFRLYQDDRAKAILCTTLGCNYSGKIPKKVLVEHIVQIDPFEWGPYYDRKRIPYTIRIWIQYDEEFSYYEFKQYIKGFLESKFDSTYDRNGIAHLIIELDEINAVEVKDEDGQGVVLYADWP